MRVRLRSLLASAVAAALAASGAGLVVGVVPAAADCGAVGQPPCPPPSLPTNSDGSLQVDSPLEPLPAPVAGEPLYARPNGRLATGFNDGALQSDAVTAADVATLHADMGGTIARIGLAWSAAQPGPGTGCYVWEKPTFNQSSYDAAYKALVERGIRPLWIVLTSPPWATRAGTTQIDCAYNGSVNGPPDPSHYADLAAFAHAIAVRYPLSAGIELWNEPNYGANWVTAAGAAANAEQYGDMLHAVYRAIKDDPQTAAMRVIGGALGNYGVGLNGPTATSETCGVHQQDNAYECDDPMQDFLARVLAETASFPDGGAAMDGVSFHPYPVDSAQSLFGPTFGEIGAALVDAGFADLRLVPDETGLTTTGSDAVTATEQSDVLTEEYDDVEQGRVPYAGQADALLFHTDLACTDAIDGEAGLAEGCGYAWVKPRNALGYFEPTQVYCTFADKLGVPASTRQPAVGTACGWIPASF